MAFTRTNKTFTRAFSAMHRGIYKLSRGRFAASMADAKIGIIGTTGRKSGKARENPVIALDHPEGWVTAASYSGHDEHPAWWLNLERDPSGTLLIGDDTHRVTASEIEADGHGEWWDKLVAVYPDYAEYQKVTDRHIPVVLLRRAD